MSVTKSPEPAPDQRTAAHDVRQQEILISADATEFALRHGVSPEVHSSDFIYKYLYDGATLKRDGIEYYFSDGRRSAEILDFLVTDHLDRQDARLSLLEFASGYGCVSRHLKRMSDKYRVVACDIHDEAIWFLRERLGVEAIKSASIPEDLTADTKFDVVFALSFFSHMPPATWTRWLVKLLALLREGGLLIFTTHGRVAAGLTGQPAMSPEGCWFHPISEQHDLSPTEYGTMIVMPNYVFSQLADIPTARILKFEEAYWWGAQDLYVVQNSATGTAPVRTARSSFPTSPDVSAMGQTADETKEARFGISAVLKRLRTRFR